MDFIIKNLVWFIVGAGVVLLTIIGYFADKSGFSIRKKKNRVNTAVQAQAEEKPLESQTINEIPKTEEIIKDVVEPIVEQVPTIEEMPVESENIAGVPAELFAPLENVENTDTVEIIGTTQSEIIDSSDGEVPIIIPELPVEENKVEEKEEIIVIPELDFPSLNTIVDDSIQVKVSEDNDIWKF